MRAVPWAVLWAVVRVVVLTPLLVGFYAVQTEPQLLDVVFAPGGVDVLELFVGLATVQYIYLVVPGAMVLAAVLPYLESVSGGE